MTDKEMESGFELELDNRKLIIGFVIFILLIGGFFVWGYGVGKRQGMQLASIAGSDTASDVVTEDTLSPAGNAKDAVSNSSLPETDESQQNPDLYQSDKDDDPIVIEPVRPSVTKKAPDPVISSKKAADPVISSRKAADPVISSRKATDSSKKAAGAATYSVQVGAFDTRAKAEVHARDVQSKGFESRVVAPESSGKLYLVKVGRFDTRTEADAMESRLKNKGFSTYVKAN